MTQLPGCTAIEVGPQEDGPTPTRADVLSIEREDGPTAAAHAALNAALRDSAPPCEGDETFTADRLSEADISFCKAMCSVCPAFDLCEAYATASSARNGFWAGHLYTAKGRT